jgi:hypothetical protein
LENTNCNPGHTCRNIPNGGRKTNPLEGYFACFDLEYS